jgi:hypothetical protein
LLGEPFLKRATIKLVAIIVILCALGVAINVTESEIWLGVWFILFIYFGVPVLLLSVADLIRSFRGTPEKSSIFSTGIHVTAVFGFLVGFLLYKMAVWSEHPSVDKHAYLPLLFVAMVYGYPAIMWIRAKATEVFFRAVSTEEVLEAPQTKSRVREPDGEE